MHQEVKDFFAELAETDKYKALRLSITEGGRRDAGLYAEAISERVYTFILPALEEALRVVPGCIANRESLDDINLTAEQQTEKASLLMQDVHKYAEEILPEWYAISDLKAPEGAAI